MGIFGGAASTVVLVVALDLDLEVVDAVLATDLLQGLDGDRFFGGLEALPDLEVSHPNPGVSVERVEGGSPVPRNTAPVSAIDTL